MSTERLSPEQIDSYAKEVLENGFCVVRSVFPRETLLHWREQFLPLLSRHIEREGHLKNRGPNRYYVSLPFTAPFADPAIYAHPDILAISEKLVGQDMFMCQLATDTPLKHSDYQEVHRDAPPLFPEMKQETPPFQLAINFALVDVTADNGPLEITRRTHLMTKEEGLRSIERGENPIIPIYTKLGDVMIRDVRGLHRGTPNRSGVPRPMVVVGYNRRWLYRPEVSVRIPRSEFARLTEREKFLLRFNPVVDSPADLPDSEVYQAFAY